MIYFVDEDVPYIQEYSVPLKLRNRSVSILANADLAYDTLETASDVELAVIDIMLATGSKETSRFSRAASEDFLKTGILLIHYLTDLRPQLFPKKFVVLTAASDHRLLRSVRECCDPLNIEILRKMDYSSPAKLAQKIESLIR
jgi:hypothetical protein